VHDPGYNPNDHNASRLYQYGNVAFADNYYRQGAWYEDVDFNGVEADSAVNYELDQAFLNGIGGLDHSDVHTWYYGSITEALPPNYDGWGDAARNHDGDTAFDDSWYVPAGMGPRDGIGYAFSRIGQHRELSTKEADPNTSPSRPLPSIFNGDFAYGGYIANEIPGWERHGGAAADLTGDGELHLGEYLTSDYTEARHNPLYFPASVNGLSFHYEITDDSNDDQLQVWIGNNLEAILPLDSIRAGDVEIPLTSYRDRVETIEFRLDYNLLIESDVYIDDVRFESSVMADAGGPYSGFEGVNVTLDASGSAYHDPNHWIVSYQWDLDNDGQYDDATGVTTTFNSAADGLFTVGLGVTADDATSDTDTAIVALLNVAPTAEAGGPYSGSEGSNITLSALGSTDPGSDIASYQWDLDNDGQYDDATGITATFNSTADGVFTVAVRVTDDDGAWNTDTAAVTVVNVAPTAEAGGPYSGSEGSNITLSASGSTDPGSDIASYQWDLDNDGQYDDATGLTTTFNSPNEGIFTVGLRVTDDDGASGTDTAAVTVFKASVQVVARHVFYNNSKWDGHAGFTKGDPAANEFDDGAIATDKTALLPGQTGTFTNYTSYPRGINGIMVDIQGLADPIAVADGDLSEFDFRYGNDDTPGDWLPAPGPLEVAVRDIGGGVHRITFVWADKAVPNKNWVQVTVKQHPNTGLAADDVFYFGNSVGENTADFRVDYSDAFDIIWPLLGTPLPIGPDHVADINRDGRIDYSDVFDDLWPNLSGPAPLKPIHPPTLPAAPFQSTGSVFDEKLSWEIELIWLDQLYGTSSGSGDSDEDDLLEATAVDGVFSVYYLE
jgi:hypothetical protein